MFALIFVIVVPFVVGSRHRSGRVLRLVPPHPYHTFLSRTVSPPTRCRRCRAAMPQPLPSRPVPPIIMFRPANRRTFQSHTVTPLRLRHVPSYTAVTYPCTATPTSPHCPAQRPSDNAVVRPTGHLPAHAHAHNQLSITPTHTVGARTCPAVRPL
jgi:hypothetical protein